MPRGMRTFDPARIAYYETENWVAYYQKRWLRLLRVSVGMVKEAFRLTLPQAMYAAYLVARAEMAAAPFPNNDIPTAQRYMRRFYAVVKQRHAETFDVEEAARLEVRWWVIHRQLFGQSENQPLVDALADLYAATFGVPRERVLAAAEHRAQAMLYSDRWVNEGRVTGNALLGSVEAELLQSYSALLSAVAPVPAGAHRRTVAPGRETMIRFLSNASLQQLPL